MKNISRLSLLFLGLCLSTLAGAQAGSSEPAKADPTPNATWTDPATALMWAGKDNGSDVNWNQADAYCSNLKLAGKNDWRLPTIEELQGIDDPSVSIQTAFEPGDVYVHVKGNLKLTGSPVSSSQVDAQGKPLQGVWSFDFVGETPRNFGFLTFSHYTRALCVRRSDDVTLYVTADMDCNWKLDGRPMGQLKAEHAKVVPVSPGEHLIQAVTTDGLAAIRTKAEVDSGQRVVKIQLTRQHAEKLRKLAEAEAVLHPTWTDPDTGLMWAKKDNGSDLEWNQADAYCSNLQLAGYNDWRLPTIEELEGTNDPSISITLTVRLCIKGDLKLTGWAWSSSQGQWPCCPSLPVAQVFTFYGMDAPRSFPVGGFSANMRALCVRASVE